jgi:hypothetical protein
MTIILRRFNYNYISENDFLLIVGMVNSGKSFLIKDILYKFQDIPIGTVISENNNKNDIYKCIPPIFIHDKYDKNILKNIIKKSEILKNNEEEYDTRSFLIFDNCFYNYRLKKDKYFEKIINYKKIYNILCLYETQEINNINEIIKNNIDYLFIMKESYDVNRRKIYEEFKKYLGIEYTVFSKLMDDYTNNYNFLVLNLKCSSQIIEDKLYWYKSNEHYNFKICSKESWDYNDKNYIIEPPKKIINRSIFY